MKRAKRAYRQIELNADVKGCSDDEEDEEEEPDGAQVDDFELNGAQEEGELSFSSASPSLPQPELTTPAPPPPYARPRSRVDKTTHRTGYTTDQVHGFSINDK